MEQDVIEDDGSQNIPQNKSQHMRPMDCGNREAGPSMPQLLSPIFVTELPTIITTLTHSSILTATTTLQELQRLILPFLRAKCTTKHYMSLRCRYQVLLSFKAAIVELAVAQHTYSVARQDTHFSEVSVARRQYLCECNNTDMPYCFEQTKLQSSVHGRQSESHPYCSLSTRFYHTALLIQDCLAHERSRHGYQVVLLSKGAIFN
jgi:hypothetical protein